MKTPDSEILFYQTEEGLSRIEVRLEDESVWLSQRLLAELYQVSVPTINFHIKNIYEEGELDRDSTIRKYLIVQIEGKREITREIDHYNLETIIAVGYRISSHRGTQFRRWATERLREYLVKGFTMDDERLREGRHLGTDYFDELLERIRDIRASEKRFYQKVRDLYALSIDYNPKGDATQEFFAIVQNKLHWAVTGMTAAELIAERADVRKPNMGLTSWKGAKVRKGDVTIAKNYLSADELSELNRFVVMYLDHAEDQTRRRNPLYMRDWREKLDAFLKFSEREVLDDSGKVSMEVAKALAVGEYDKFEQVRRELETKEADEEFEEVAKRIEGAATSDNKSKVKKE
ncbi:virulence RhuM family protein [bacterium]|nr:virulence RhuM family protein [bacterium]